MPQFPGISSLCVRPQGPLEAEPPVAPTSLALKVLAFGLLVALDGGQEMLLADAHQASVAGGVPLARETLDLGDVLTLLRLPSPLLFPRGLRLRGTRGRKMFQSVGLLGFGDVWL